eukprot:362150-Chlamydomonas_euryale.AAC.1
MCTSAARPRPTARSLPNEETPSALPPKTHPAGVCDGPRPTARSLPNEETPSALPPKTHPATLNPKH